MIKERKKELENKLLAFNAALNFIFSSTADNKVTKVARALAGITEDEAETEEFRKIVNQLYSITNNRATPKDYLAQMLYDKYPSESLLEILCRSFFIKPKEETESEPTPIEEELPELLLDRIRELKAEHDDLVQTIKTLEEERQKSIRALQESLDDGKVDDGVLKEVLKILKSTQFFI